MVTKTLYRYIENNNVIYSLNKPSGEHTEYYCLIADEGKVLTKDEENFYTIIDIEKADLPLWQEINKPETFGLYPEV